MKIIPAIDIMDGRVVRLERGEFDKGKVYSENPAMVAREWKRQGAEMLHIVDLDGARLGKPVNLDIVRDIVKEIKLEVELGGGLRTEECIRDAFKAGVRFAVIGTSALRDEAFCKAVLDRFGDRIIFAVDVKGRKVAIKGWKETSETEALEYIKKLEALGAERIIYTDISRDGMMQGPDLEALKSVLQATTLEVTASGGVSCMDDIKALKAMEKDGLRAVIAGKALYEGKINLTEALIVGKKDYTVP